MPGPRQAGTGVVLRFALSPSRETRIPRGCRAGAPVPPCAGTPPRPSTFTWGWLRRRWAYTHPLSACAPRPVAPRGAVTTAAARPVLGLIHVELASPELEAIEPANGL
jgi:hypothetical protein